MSAIGLGIVIIAYSSNCLISSRWLASITEGDDIINATLLLVHYSRTLIDATRMIKNMNHISEFDQVPIPVNIVLFKHIFLLEKMHQQIFSLKPSLSNAYPSILP